MFTYLNFFPKKEAEQVKWLNNYIQTLPEIGAALNMTNEDVEAKLNDARIQLGLIEDANVQKVKKQKAFTLKKVNLHSFLLKLKKDVGSMKSNAKWTPEFSAKLLTDNIRFKKDLSGFQPEVVLSQNGSLVQIDYTKYGASGAHIYRKLPGETIMSMIGRSTDSTFIDPLPLAVQGVPELRQYMVVILVKDKETGLPSKIMTIVLGA